MKTTVQKMKKQVITLLPLIAMLWTSNALAQCFTDPVAGLKVYTTSSGTEFSWLTDNTNTSHVYVQVFYDEAQTQPVGNKLVTYGDGKTEFVSLNCETKYYYKVRAYSTASGGCYQEGNEAGDFIACQGALSLEKSLKDDLFQIYPNPVKNQLHIELKEDVQYELMSLSGKTIQSGMLGISANQLDFSKLPSGIYLLQLSGPWGSHTHKVMKP
ncbi:MAG: T9SS type A sorting domain-containing protein [Bacteroidetes bacterium]|nr:MAG: T9SS type A sorting domain-containing protein [Bacteroidota bacterium]